MRVLHVGDDFAALRLCGLTLYAEALMDGQSERGHQVAYVFSGRHYPKLDRPRLKRWRRNQVQMFELVGSPLQSHWELGTSDPEADLEERAGETAFAVAVREMRPDVVHVQELARLPSSILPQAHRLGLPVVMTLHDYRPICATVRLLDGGGSRCRRLDVGEDCARNCSAAPQGRAHLIDWTLRYERRRAKRAVPALNAVDLSAAGPIVGAVTRLLASGPAASAGASPEVRVGADPDAYQRRRDVNVARLSACDRLIAPSERAREIYTELGVDPARFTVQRLTLPHLAELRPSRSPEVHRPLHFVTVGGCAGPTKGSDLVVGAVRHLEEAGRGGEYRLTVLGHVAPAAAQVLSRVPSVHLAGTYLPHQLGDLLDAPDLGLLPSIWEETHGFVGIEMLAKGLPLIANPLGGIPEYVEPGRTGWLNHDLTDHGMARLMIHAIENPPEVERLRNLVRQMRPRLVRPMSEHLEEVEALYREVVDQRTRMSRPAAERAAS